MLKPLHLPIGTVSETCSSPSMAIRILQKSAKKSLQFCEGEFMARHKRGRPRGAALRRKRAAKASERLSEILIQPWNHTSETVNSATAQMWNIGTRHRIGLHNQSRVWICRQCKILLRPGLTARVRIRQGVRITTCLQCNHVTRRGPNFVRGAQK